MAERNSNSYKLLANLDGQHDDTIACMQFSPCGKYLVTGGDDLRMNVFDCTKMFRNILSISSTSSPSAVCWDPTKPKSCFVGYSSGAVVSHTFGNDTEEWAAEISLFNGRCRIVALAWDKTLAVATERSVCLIKDIKTSTDSQHGTISISPPATNHGRPEPRSVCFTPDGSLVIAYLEHGVTCWSPDGQTLRWSFAPRAFRIGRFSYSPKTDLFIVHNLYDGFDAYTMKSRAHFRSYRFPTSEKDNVPLSCTLIDGGRHVICGTTSGKAVILDAITLAHQAELFHCESGLVQDIAYCNASGVNMLATTASEKGVETTIKIWTADVIPGQFVGCADRITEAFRSGIDLLGDLCGQLVCWYSYKIEISILPFILWVLVLVATFAALSYLNLGGFGLSLHSACRSFWVSAKEAFFEGGPAFQRALKFGIRTCYSFLKGVAIALHEFLEEQPERPSPHMEAVGSILADSVAARLDVTEFGGALGNQDFGAAQGIILEVKDALGKQGSRSLDGTALSTPVENALDWVTSAGFQRVEVDVSTEGGVPGSPSIDQVTTDVAIHANWLPSS